MSKIHILQFRTPSSPAPLQHLSPTTPSYRGLRIQDANITQLTTITPEPSSDISSLLPPNTTPTASYTVHLNTPFFGPQTPGSAPIVEHVLISFPKSRATPAFRSRIEADFAVFNTIVKRGARGDIGVAWGWVQESLSHESLGEGEEAMGFVVIRGWESMRDFENVLGTEEYKEAIPLLMAWEAPFDMVSLRVRGVGWREGC
jgi:hypothetical protein